MGRHQKSCRSSGSSCREASSAPAQRSTAGFEQMLKKDAQGSPRPGCAGWALCWGATSPSLGTAGGDQARAAPSLARHPGLCQAAHPRQSLSRGRGRAILPAAPAYLPAWSRLRRCGHPFPQRGGGGMPHLRPDPGCCRLNQR